MRKANVHDRRKKTTADVPAKVSEATVVAGGEVVGRTADAELLVEGPNSE